MSAGLAEIGAEDFDLEATLSCGQVFHWGREGAGWLGAVGDAPVYLEQSGGRLFVSAGAEETAARYLALDHPLAEIRASFPADPAMTAAAEFCRGLRIVRQPAWECLATFITSAMKQVPHIAQISHTLRRRFGARLEWAGRELFAYPTATALARLSEAELRECALGFRAKNLRAGAGVSHRRVDRAGAAGAVFQKETEGDFAAAASVCGGILRPIRRLRAAVSLSPRADDVARAGERLMRAGIGG